MITREEMQELDELDRVRHETDHLWSSVEQHKAGECVDGFCLYCTANGLHTEPATRT